MNSFTSRFSWLLPAAALLAGGFPALAAAHVHYGAINDDCSDAIAIEDGSTGFSTFGATTGGPDLPMECEEGYGLSFPQDIWYLYTATATGILNVSTCGSGFDTRLALYTGDCANLELTACIDDNCQDFTSLMSAGVVKGETYILRVGTYFGPGGTITISYGDAPPMNDDCSDAIAIGDGNTEFSTNGAITVGPEIPVECTQSFPDIWYFYTATATGFLNVSTCGQATFDTLLSLFTGDCASLEFIACADDNCSFTTSFLSADVVKGETYLLRVGGFGNGSGTITISYGDPPSINDDCSDAIAIEDGNTEFSTNGASTDGADLDCDDGFGLYPLGLDIWYTYQPTCSGTVTVSTCQSVDFDNRLAAYTGDCDGLELVGCIDDGPCGLDAVLTFESVCGETYLIRVGGAGNESGTGTLTVTCAGDPCPTGCVEDLTGDGQVNGADLGEFLGQWGGAGSADFDGSGAVDGSDLGQFLGAWGPCR